MVYSSICGLNGVWLYWWVVWGIALLVGCVGYSSIGGLCGVCVLYWWAVWGMTLLVGCMGHSSIIWLYGV